MAHAPGILSLTLSELSDEEQQELKLLRMRLLRKEKRNKLRSNYYDGKHRLAKLGISIPPQMRDIETVVGWPAKSVDVLEQRLEHEGFVLPSRSPYVDELADIDARNNMSVERSQAHVSALTHGTAFAFVTAGDEADGDPEVVISVRSARQATGLYDRRRRRLTAALEMVADEKDREQWMILHRPGEVVTIERSSSGHWRVENRTPNPTGRVTAVPLVHRPFVERPFGMSRITRPVMSLTDTAVRTILRTEVSAEFYSAPQRYALGADEESFTDKDGRVKTGWETVLGQMLAIPHPTPDEDGDQPPEMKVGQFPQQSMTPHTEHLRSTATMFGGETAIPVSYLGIIHDNPASADAIRATESELVKIAERDHTTFGWSWAQVGRLAIMVRDGLTEIPDELNRLRSRWRDPATPTKQAQAQSVMSLVSSGVYQPRSEVTFEELGLDQTKIDRLKAEDRRTRAERALANLTAAAQQTEGDQEVDELVGAPGGA